MTDVQNPVAQPLGGATVSGTQITVDVLVNPPTQIPQVIRDLVAANVGYFAEDVFASPGILVQGGAVIYTETFPSDLFLDPNANIAPRAPGAEAARIGSLRRPPKVGRPESWAGSIEVTDEARRRNDVLTVTRQFTTAANSFADKMQTRMETTLQAAIDAWGRTIPTAHGWRIPLSGGVDFVNPATLPGVDFAAVTSQFVADKAGVRPDTLILHQNDAQFLDVIYAGGRLQQLLDRYGITSLYISPRQTEGKATFVKSKQVGAVLFEKALDQEYTREGERKTDVYTLEVVPAFVAIDASAVVQVTGINASS